MKGVIAVVCLVACIHACVGEVTFANTFGDNMVFEQSPARPAVWGKTTASDNITVSMDGTKLGVAKASATGAWKYELPATTGSFAPHVISAHSAEANTTAELTNVLFGDVWLCGGQSNMGIPLEYVDDAEEEIKKTADYPNVRVMRVRSNVTSLTPFEDLLPEQVEIAWTAPSNASVPVSNMGPFSAVCWFFGRDLFDELKYPIGLIQDQWGGTPVQAWSNKEALTECERDDVAASEIKQADSQPAQSTPSVLWNAMIYPFLQMSLKGAIWYQGEANVNGGDEWGPEFYKCGFPAMIKSWRKEFNAPTMPFLYVQLAPYCNADSHCNGSHPITQVDYLIPALREAQRDTLTAVTGTGMAVAGDLGDQTAPAGSVHPRHKEPVGKRLAANAMVIAYRKSIPYKGPQPVRATVSGDTVTITFDPVFNYGGLVETAAKCPEGGMQPASCTGSGFEVYATKAGATGWHHATSEKVEKSAVTVQCTGATDIRDVRYAYADWPLMTVYNKEAFPLGQFFLSVSAKTSNVTVADE